MPGMWYYSKSEEKGMGTIKAEIFKGSSIRYGKK
jgi:hypothetical protein